MTSKRNTPLREYTLAPDHCSIELRHDILGRASYFKELSPQMLAAVNAQFREQHFSADTVICREGEPATRLFFTAHGKVKLLRHSLRGDDVLLDLLPQGALFGGLTALGVSNYPETAIAQTDCCVLTITATAFQQLLEQHQEITLAVLNTVARSLDDARTTIHQLITSSAEARIANVLLKLAERLGEQTKDGLLIQSPLPQQDIAAMVGVTPETVSRTMAQFKRDGLIDAGRQWVRLLDQKGLQYIAQA